MGLRKALYDNRPVEAEIVEIADEVFPDLWQGRVAPEYRLLILKEFLDREGMPPKPNRNRSERRFDRAIYALDDAIDRDGKGTIAGCALEMYDERSGATAKFIDDLREIESRITREQD